MARISLDPRMLLSVAVLVLSAGLVVHWLAAFAEVLRRGAAQARVAIDFNIYRCAMADIARSYGTCGNGGPVGGFVYPPPSIGYFKALALMPVNAAFALHGLVLMFAIGMATWMLVRTAPQSRVNRIAAAAACVAIAPIASSLMAGQVNPIVMAACVAATYCSVRGNHARAGLAVALGFWLKLYPAILPVLYLTRRRIGGIGWTIAATLAVALLSLAWASPALFVEYFLGLLPHVQGYTMPGVAHSLAGIFAHIAIGGGEPVAEFVPVAPALLLASKALLGAGVLGAMLHQRLTADSRPMETLGVLLAGALLAAPNAWGWHYALIVPALFVALADALDRWSWRTPLVLVCWLALCVPDWTTPPGFIADEPWLNVLVRGRYAFAAMALVVVAFSRIGDVRSGSTSPA